MSKLVPLDISTTQTIDRLPDTTNRNYRDFRKQQPNQKERPTTIEFGGSRLVYSIWTHRAKKKKGKG